MEEEGMNPAEVDYNTKVKTASSIDQCPSHHRCAEEVAHERAQQTALFPKKDQEEVTWTWKRQQMQGLSASISLYCKKKVFKDIRSVLTAVGGEKLLQQFLDGCFGHLMHFIGGTSCCKALHELISHEIILPGAREDELWFHISGTNIRFAPADYALVTGLRFGSCSFDPLGSHEMPPNGVYERFCHGQPVTVKELWKQFNLQHLRGSSEDYLKVAHILVLYLMALGYDQLRRVDEWVWVLVDDLDLWNKFPWGAYTYQALMHYVSVLPKTRAGLAPHYHFNGPAWALLIWAYEAIPHLGNTCALVTGQFTIPRCLKWSFLNSWYIDFAHFSEQELVCSVTLEPTDEEQLQPYWVSVRTPQPLGVRYAHPWNPIKNLQGALQGAEPAVRWVAATARQEKAPFSSDHSGSVSASPQLLRRSSRLASLVDDSSSEPVSTPTPSARPKRARGSTCLTPSSGGKHGRPQHVPEWPEVFDEARFVDQLSGRMVDRLLEPVADRMIEPVAKMVTQRLIEQVPGRMVDRLLEPVADRMIEPVAKMVTQRLIEPVVERLSQQLIPHMKQWVEDLFHQRRQSPSRHNPPHTPSSPFSRKTSKKKSRQPPSSDNEGSESSSGEERRRGLKKRFQKKKSKYSESSSSESSDSSETSDSDAR